jgi:anti-sigma factor RsiW
MTCRDAQALAGNYLDGELPDEMCDRLRRHLLKCAACREECDSLRMAVEVLRETHGPPAAGEAFVREMLETLARELGLPAREEETPGQLVLRMQGGIEGVARR